MNAIHRTLDGNWAECVDPACKLLFHFPDLTLTEVNQLPMHVLLPLVNTIDPPQTVAGGGSRYWMVEESASSWLYHRDYDLPAIIHPVGVMEWCQNGLLHRERDLPAYVASDGTQRWYQHGEPHRAGGKPAVICPDGTQEWWEYGVELTAYEAANS